MTNIVDTKLGKIQGHSEKGLVVFKGVPFAKPPIGDLRFRAPQPMDSWSDVFDANEFRDDAPQPDSPLEGLFSTPRDKSEDCLYLNIWTPAIDSQKRPVMVWVHGGGFTTGGGARDVYSGSKIALRGNVVVVTINYRLGVLGYFYIPRETANVGMLDQVAALRWVNENIENFGGDPNNVTIFGESAGGFSVSTLITMPAAKGLFQRVIAESGACHPIVYNAKTARSASRNFLKRLKVEDIDGLRKIPVKKIIRTQTKVLRLNEATGLPSPFWPIVDGDSIPEHPMESLRKGYAKGIDLLIGTNQDEMKLWNALRPTGKEMTEDEMMQRARMIFGFLGKSEDQAKELIEKYKLARKGKFSNSPDELTAAIGTDLMFRISAIRMAEAHLPHQPNTYMYLFNWPSPAFNGKLGSCHAVEIPFVFGTHKNPKMDVLVGSGPETDILSEKMMDAWIAFAKTGDPSHEKIPKWPRYDTETRATMLIGKEFKVLYDPFKDERLAWDGII